MEWLIDTGMVRCAASLAHHGLLDSVYVESMMLSDVDLSPVPAQHLASLASCVSDRAGIYDVSGCGLVSFIDGVQCIDTLWIRSQSLGREETWALVQAMVSSVQNVELHDEVTLDIEALAEYRGNSRCTSVKLFSDTAARYREQLRTWARNIKWGVTQDGSRKLSMNMNFHYEP